MNCARLCEDDEEVKYLIEMAKRLEGLAET